MKVELHRTLVKDFAKTSLDLDTDPKVDSEEWLSEFAAGRDEIEAAMERVVGKELFSVLRGVAQQDGYSADSSNLLVWSALSRCLGNATRLVVDAEQGNCMFFCLFSFPVLLVGLFV